MTASGTVKIELSRVIRASRKELFAAWTRPEIIRRWFAPEGMIVASASADLRVGGEFRITVQAAEEEAVFMGTYREIVMDSKLVFTLAPRKGELAAETLVTLSFRDVFGGTEVSIMHEKLSVKDLAEHVRQDWVRCVERLIGLAEVAPVA